MKLDPPPPIKLSSAIEPVPWVVVMLLVFPPPMTLYCAVMLLEAPPPMKEFDEDAAVPTRAVLILLPLPPTMQQLNDNVEPAVPQ